MGVWMNIESTQASACTSPSRETKRRGSPASSRSKNAASLGSVSKKVNAHGDDPLFFSCC